MEYGGHMYEEDYFRQVLERYEDMIERKSSFFFDVEEFGQIIDYYVEIRNFKKAREAIDIAANQHPDSSEIILKLIHYFIETGQPSVAIDKFKEIPEWDLDNPDVYLLRGTALAQLGKINEAEKQFDIAISKTEEDKAEILINISSAFENAKKINIAIKYLRMAYELEPDNLTVLYDLGFFYERMHDYNTSLEFYNKYLDEDPYSDNVWYNLGVVYYKLNLNEKAIEAYDFAIAINPSYASAYFNKANIYANDTDFLKAISVYHDFLSLEQEHIQAWCYLGECYEQVEDFDKALRTYKKVIELDNSNPEGWYGAGLAYLSLGKYKDAISYMLKAVELDSENSDYWFHLGESYEKLDSVSEAVKCYRQTTILDPKDSQAWYNLSMISFRHNDYHASAEIINQAFAVIPDDPDLLLLEAACYFRLSQRTSGILSLKKALTSEIHAGEEFLKLFPEGLQDPEIMKLLKKVKK